MIYYHGFLMFWWLSTLFIVVAAKNGSFSHTTSSHRVTFVTYLSIYGQQVKKNFFPPSLYSFDLKVWTGSSAFRQCLNIYIRPRGERRLCEYILVYFPCLFRTNMSPPSIVFRNDFQSDFPDGNFYTDFSEPTFQYHQFLWRWTAG